MPNSAGALHTERLHVPLSPYYADDRVTLYLGDCRDVTEWLSADVLVTDPPYGIRWDPRHGDKRGPRSRRSRTPDAITGDGDASARDAALALWGDRPALTFGTWRVDRPSRIHALLIWHKEGAYTAACRAPFFTNHEEIYALGSGWPIRDKPLRSVITTTEHRSQHTAKIGHPTPKPLSLMETLVLACPPGAIADPFAGSGSTLVAARNLGRRAIGVEIEERYAEIAARRLAQDCLDLGETA